MNTKQIWDASRKEEKWCWGRCNEQMQQPDIRSGRDKVTDRAALLRSFPDKISRRIGRTR